MLRRGAACRGALSSGEHLFVESFNGRGREELLNGEDFATLDEARVIVEVCRVEDNTERPHSARGGYTPDEYAHRHGTRATASPGGGPARPGWRSPDGRGRDRNRVVDYPGRWVTGENHK